MKILFLVNKKRKLFLLLSLILLIFIFFPKPVFGAAGIEFGDSFNIMMLKSITTSIKSIMEVCTNLVKMTPEGFAGSVSGSIKNLNAVFVGIGSSLLVIFWGMGMFATVGTYSDLKRPEVFVRVIVRFLVCKELLTRSFELMQFIYSLIHTLIEKAISGLGFGSMDMSALKMPQAVVDSLKENSGPMDNMVSFIFILFTAMAAFSAMISIFVSVFSRFFKIFMYEGVAPIPISTFGGQQTSHVGQTFLKAFAGIGLQGLLIVISFGIFKGIMNSPAQNILNIDFFGDEMPLLQYSITLMIYVILLRTIITGIDQIAQKMMGL